MAGVGDGDSDGEHTRQVGDAERRIFVEVIRLDEALQQVPTHLERFIGREVVKWEQRRMSWRLAPGYRRAARCKVAQLWPRPWRFTRRLTPVRRQPVAVTRASTTAEQTSTETATMQSKPSAPSLASASPRLALPSARSVGTKTCPPA